VFKAKWIPDDDLRRKNIMEYAQWLADNKTPAGEALALITAYTAAFYEDLGVAAVFAAGKFVDDIALVLVGKSGYAAAQQGYYQNEDPTYFIGQFKFAQTDLYPWFQDPSPGLAYMNQAYHFWYFVTVSFWDTPIAATAGNLYHELASSQHERSFQDFALSVAATDLGYQLATFKMSIFGVSNWIRANLIPFWY
jgi:hypothetical protein